MSEIEIPDAALNAARDASAAPLSCGNGRGAIDAALKAAAPLIVAAQKAAELRSLARDLRATAALMRESDAPLGDGIGLVGEGYDAGLIDGYEAAALVADVRADELDRAGGAA